MKAEFSTPLIHPNAVDLTNSKSVSSANENLKRKKTLLSDIDGPRKKKKKKNRSDETSVGSKSSISVSSKSKRNNKSSNASVSSSKSMKKSHSGVVGSKKRFHQTSTNIAGSSSSLNTPDTPLSLHAAIAQVKERFPIRRQYKDLGTWEGACSRFYRELLRHPWLGAARPKFVFHAPVLMLFPEVKEAYSKKIETPMDLTTAESKLLQGGIYTNCQEFVDDVALVFVNAITFNQNGRNEGDPMSCAYFDAANHLLRYIRWLSLEYLVQYLVDDSDSPNSFQKGEMTWALTTSIRKKSRDEMESIVLKEPMSISEPGDRYTWMESECEKLLKALRHQSDLRYMTYFIQPQYPGDYAAYVSKPMDWEKCQRRLQQRLYTTIGHVVDDLRLIFLNALKYNVRAKGTETVSGRAYEAAKYMSTKLESAIDKMVLSVAERLERDKIDKVTAEREVEAQEQQEQERLRAAWHKEREKARAEEAATEVEIKTRVETVETVKVIQRKTPKREVMPFDYLYHDEDVNVEHTSHLEAIRQQKLAFEKQIKDRVEMRKRTLQIANKIYNKLIKRKKIVDSISSRNSNSSNNDSKEDVKENIPETKKKDVPVAQKLNVRVSFKLRAKERKTKINTNYAIFVDLDN